MSMRSWISGSVSLAAARRGAGPTLAKDIRGPVEQLLELVVPGFTARAVRIARCPFADAVPGFFGYLAGERGLRPASVARLPAPPGPSRRCLRGPGSPGCTSCLRRC